jgi:hypothetical protein
MQFYRKRYGIFICCWCLVCHSIPSTWLSTWWLICQNKRLASYDAMFGYMEEKTGQLVMYPSLLNMFKSAIPSSIWIFMESITVSRLCNILYIYIPWMCQSVQYFQTVANPNISMEKWVILSLFPAILIFQCETFHFCVAKHEIHPFWCWALTTGCVKKGNAFIL